MWSWRSFALLIACASCSDVQNCTLAACSSGFSIALGKPPASGVLTSADALPEGEYELELSLDGKVVTCHRTVPLERSLDCMGSRGDAVAVDPSGPMYLEGTITGFAVEIREAPRVVNVIASYRGSVLAQGTFTPMYHTVAPNGMSCGPVCDVAPSETLALSL